MFSSHGSAKSLDSLSALSPSSPGELASHSRMTYGFPRPRSRRGSTASSLFSAGGVPDGAAGNWATPVVEAGQNAISTLLQPPIVRTGLQPHTSAPSSTTHKPPTSRDIPPVTLTNIQRISTDEFAPYISQFSALYEQLRRVKESEEDSQNNRRSSKQDDASESTADGLLRPGSKPSIGRKGSTASLSSLNSIDAPTIGRRSSSGLTRKVTQGPPPLSTIPTVYFDDDFHLENPRTFDVVSERSEVIPPTSASAAGKKEGSGSAAAPRKALATNAILQEKLSWYMDTIEVHLINSISSASTTFFTALGSLKELHSEAADSVERIKALRRELGALDEEVATTGLQVSQQRRRQENLKQLNDAVLQLKRIVEGLANCEQLVEAGEVDKALATIDALENLIAGERGEDEPDSGLQLRDLRGASALQGVSLDLKTLRFRVGKAFESQFIDVLMTDLRKHTETVAVPDVLLRWSNAASRVRGANHARSPSVFPAYLSGTEDLRSQVLPSLSGLHRAEHVIVAASAYREVVMREIRNLIRRPLPSSNDDDNESMMSVSTSGGRQLSNQDKSSILARNLRALDPEDAEELLTKIYVGIAETLRRLTTQVKVLLDIASSISDPAGLDGLKSPPMRSPLPSPRIERNSMYPPAVSPELQEELHKTLDITNFLSQAVDVAIDKIVKILRVRSAQASQLPLDLFLRYFTLNLYFATECEAISGRSGTSLKNVVNGHIKDFVQKSGDAAMQRLAQEMEKDQWNAKDFDEKNVELLNHILECSTHDPESWTEKNRIWVPYSEVVGGADTTAEPAETNGSGKEKARTATIDEQQFVLPNPAVLCLEGIAEFLHLVTGIPMMATEVGSSLVAYLNMFNSRCTQLILGAGATKSAGLKNITTKHLALASQALAFIATLIPHIREFVRRHAGSGVGVSNLMGEFDKVRRLLQEHQDNIHQKLVQIMEGRAALHAKTMKTLDWDAAPPRGARSYMETLAKETTTLHRVLTKHLPETSIQMIMHPVFSSYKDHLGNAMREAAPKTQAGQER
ncbi:Vps54-like protein-domain-containing protein [Stachybotrys elegans]|uniref:Vacuolar protein sorting-associated protein 54 n=1 Tax=Stachybotrys elegans TaxID=80388 RepID=A0A8K0SRJ8_9HYPO|nr:Vps54-like protein-domain-containing protein [Stachybotrys elegans]